eukprot:scaffold10963_cov24-Tisochrysis_lutea.AAC.1
MVDPVAVGRRRVISMWFERTMVAVELLFQSLWADKGWKCVYIVVPAVVCKSELCAQCRSSCCRQIKDACTHAAALQHILSKCFWEVACGRVCPADLLCLLLLVSHTSFLFAILCMQGLFPCALILPQ